MRTRRAMLALDNTNIIKARSRSLKRDTILQTSLGGWFISLTLCQTASARAVQDIILGFQILYRSSDNGDLQKLVHLVRPQTTHIALNCHIQCQSSWHGRARVCNITVDACKWRHGDYA